MGEPLAGDASELSGVYLLILMILRSPQELLTLLPSWGDARLNVVPMEHWASAVSFLESDPTAIGSTFHLTDPKPMTVRDAFHQAIEIRERLAAEGFEMPPLGRIFRRDQQLRERLQGIVARPRAFLNMAFRNVFYDTRQARAVLEPAGIDCPPLTEYFEALVRQSVQMVGSCPSESPQAQDEHG